MSRSRRPPRIHNKCCDSYRRGHSPTSFNRYGSRTEREKKHIVINTNKRNKIKEIYNKFSTDTSTHKTKLKHIFERCNKIRRKELSTINNKDKENIGIEYGNRILIVGSYNVDNLRTNESIESLEHNLNQNNIDIACIQETHNEKKETEEKGNYIIIYGGCKVEKNIINNTISRKAGISIAIKKTLINNISQINRINERIMTLELKTARKQKTLLSSIATHHIMAMILKSKPNIGMT